MWDIILESVNTIISGLIFVYLLWIGRKRQLFQQHGWAYIITGFGLIFLGNIFDFTDNFPSLNKYSIIGDTVYEAFIEKFIGCLIGYILIFTGFWYWLPTLTKQRQTEKTLQQSEQRYRNLVENVRDVIYTVSRDGTITSLNPIFEEITGWPPEEWIGKHFSKIIYPDDLPIAIERLQSVLRGETPSMFELRTLSKSGEYLVGEFMATPQFQSGEVVGMLGVARDVTERKFAEKSLRESKETLEKIAQGIKENILLISKDFKILWSNKAAVASSGLKNEEIIGNYCYRVTHKRENPCESFSESCPISEFTKTGQTAALTHTHFDNYGDKFFVEVSAYPIKDENGNVVQYVHVSRDITEHHKLEEQLRHAQKMEAVGHLAGGIAHDFNNILTAIIGYGTLLQMKLGKDNPLRHNVEQILTSTGRAANLTQSLLTFSRKQMISLKPAKITAIVKKVEKLLLRLIGEDIELKTILTDEDLTVIADSGQIEQVLMNLATNARDAMPEGGLLTVATDCVELDNEFIKIHDYGKPGMYALISVTDTGAGMDEKTKEKIFEPFFTTKDLGKGTGLGLAIVYAIVKQHNGYINVYSELGKGTTFKIYLPLTKLEVEETKPTESTTPIGGMETVLVTEDDSEVRVVTKDILEEFGYTVIEAVDGEEAIKKFTENKGKIDLVLLDVIMPKKNGKETYNEIKKMRPDIKALFTSGYPADVINKKELFEEGLNFILKPVSPAEVLKKVREVLDKDKS